MTCLVPVRIIMPNGPEIPILTQNAYKFWKSAKTNKNK